MVRTRSPVRIWLSAPEKTSLTTRDVFSGAGGHLRQKALPTKRSAFFFRCVSSPSKALPTKRSAFFFRCDSAPEKKPHNTRDVFLELGGISVKNISYNEGRFFGAGGISVKSAPNKEECFFLPLCFIFLKKHVQKLGLKLSSVGLVLKNPCPSECFFCKVLCLPLMCSQKRPTVRNRAFLFFAICFQRFARRFG